MMFKYLLSIFQPKHIRLNNKAYKLCQKGRFNEAVILYKKSLEIENESITYYNLGTVYAELEMIDDEINAYENAIKLGLNKYYLSLMSGLLILLRSAAS